MTVETLETRVRTALRGVPDPETGVNLVDLGLVYNVRCHESGIQVALTMTSPASPLADRLLLAAERAIEKAVPDALAIEVELVWDPPWHAGMMSEAARRALGTAEPPQAGPHQAATPWWKRLTDRIGRRSH